MSLTCVILASLLYILGIGGTVVYFSLSDISTALKLVLIIFICLAAYSGSRILASVFKSRYEFILKVTLSFIFVIYILFLISLVFFDNRFGRTGFGALDEWSRESFVFYLENYLNILPFRTIISLIVGVINSAVTVKAFAVNILGNLLAFAPFGIFLPMLFKKLEDKSCFIKAMTYIILSVEVLQFVLLTGSCDIDDLILNLLGSFIIYKINMMSGLQEKLLSK